MAKYIFEDERVKKAFAKDVFNIAMATVAGFSGSASYLITRNVLKNLLLDRQRNVMNMIGVDAIAIKVAFRTAFSVFETLKFEEADDKEEEIIDEPDDGSEI